MKTSELIPWREVRERMLASCTPGRRSAYARALNKARDRYRSEIRQYRGIDRLRRMYGKKRFRR